jgi:hypothetical protein
MAAQLFVILPSKATFSFSCLFITNYIYILVKIKNMMKRCEEMTTSKNLERVKMENEVFATHSKCHSRPMQT